MSNVMENKQVSYCALVIMRMITPTSCHIAIVKKALNGPKKLLNH